MSALQAGLPVFIVYDKHLRSDVLFPSRNVTKEMIDALQIVEYNGRKLQIESQIQRFEKWQQNSGLSSKRKKK